LWHLFKFVELFQNQRQTTNDPLLGICNRLRVGETTTEDIEVLLKCVLKPDGSRSDGEATDFSDAIYFFPTVKQVESHNSKKITQKKETGVQTSHFMAKDTHRKGPKKGLPLDEQETTKIVPRETRDCGGIPTRLEIFVGERIMLKRNISVSYGLVNGSIGIITSISWPGGRR